MLEQEIQEAEWVLGGKKTLVFRDENLRHGFSQVPNLILRDAALTDKAVRLYILLLSYAWREGQCFPGQDTLAQDMGCSPASVIRTLEELRERKLVTWKRRGQGKTSLYYIERLDGGYLPRPFVDKGSRG